MNLGTIGLELKISRIKRGIKQLQLHQVSGVSLKRLSLIENGWIEPKQEEIIAIKRVLSDETEFLEIGSSENGKEERK